MLLPGMIRSNEDYVNHFEEHMFWSVESTEALDGQAMAIDIIGRSRYGKTLILLDGEWDPEHVPRLRLYRICPGSERLPDASKTTVEFVRWCLDEEERLGVPVMVAWAIEQENEFDPDDCWHATVHQGTEMLLRVRDGAQLGMLDTIARAFNEGRRSSCYELPEKLHWYYADADFFYASDLYNQVEDTYYGDLADRLVHMHRKIGDVTPALVRSFGQRYEPALLNPTTREGFRIAHHGVRVVMTYNALFPETHTICTKKDPVPDERKPESVHSTKAWHIPKESELVMDVLIETITEGCRDDAWYRLDLKDLLERCTKRETAEVLLRAVTKDAPAEIREINKYGSLIRDLSDRYWSWKIFSTPWINRAGTLLFLNGCALIPYWIVKIGTRLEDDVDK